MEVNTPPDRRKNDNWKEYLERRLQRFFARSLAAFAIIGLTSAGSLLGFGIVVKQNSRRGKDIQQQRFDGYVMNCEDQNRRHAKTIMRAQNALPLESLETVTLLVDELQPFVKDCRALARKRVKGTS